MLGFVDVRSLRLRGARLQRGYGPTAARLWQNVSGQRSLTAQHLKPRRSFKND